MTDLLEDRLSALGTVEVGPPPPVAALRAGSRSRARRSGPLGPRHALVGAAAAVLLVGGVVAALDRPDAPGSTVLAGESTTSLPDPEPSAVAPTPTTSTTLPEPKTRPTGPREQIWTPDGSGAWYYAEPVSEPPALVLGTGRYPIRGFEVFDETDTFIGYFLEGSTGFLPLASTTDLAAMDELSLDLYAELAFDTTPAGRAHAKASFEADRARIESVPTPGPDGSLHLDPLGQDSPTLELLRRRAALVAELRAELQTVEGPLPPATEYRGGP